MLKVEAMMRAQGLEEPAKVYLIDPCNTGEGEEVHGLLIAHAVATRHANKVSTGYHQPTMWSVAAGYT